MSHTYPLGKTAHAALKNAQGAARTRYEAEALAGVTPVASLETEWLTPAAKDLEHLLKQAEESPAHGFVQHYEDAAGNTVLAVTYWKLAKAKAKKSKPAPKPEEDHTDDLYFRSGRTKKRKPKPVDPNQFDLFKKPEKPD